MSESFLSAVVLRAADSRMTGEFELPFFTSSPPLTPDSPINDDEEEPSIVWVRDPVSWTFSVQRNLELWKLKLEGSLACRCLCSILAPMPRPDHALALLASEVLTHTIEKYLIAYVAAALDEEVRSLAHNDRIHGGREAKSSFSRAPDVLDDDAELYAPGSVASCQVAARSLLNLPTRTRRAVLQSLQRPITWPILVALTPELAWQQKRKTASALGSVDAAGSDAAGSDAAGSDAAGSDGASSSNSGSRMQLLDPLFLRKWLESSRKWLALRWAAQEEYESSDALGLFQDHEEVIQAPRCRPRPCRLSPAPPKRRPSAAQAPPKRRPSERRPIPAQNASRKKPPAKSLPQKRDRMLVLLGIVLLGSLCASQCLYIRPSPSHRDL